MSAAAPFSRVDLAPSDRFDEHHEDAQVRHSLDSLNDAVLALVDVAREHEELALNTRAARVERRLEDVRRARHAAMQHTAPVDLTPCDGREVIAETIETSALPSVEFRLGEEPALVDADALTVASATRALLESFVDAPSARGVIELNTNESGQVVLSASTDTDLPVAELTRLAGRVQDIVDPAVKSTETRRITMSGPEVHVALPAVQASTGAAGTSVDVRLPAA